MKHKSLLLAVLLLLSAQMICFSDDPPSMPVLTEFEQYLASLPQLYASPQQGAPLVGGSDVSTVQLIWYSPDSFLAVMDLGTGNSYTWRLYASGSQTGTELATSCTFDKSHCTDSPWLVCGDLGGTLKLCWMDGWDQLKYCEMSPGEHVVRDLASWTSSVSPVAGVVIADGVGGEDEDVAGWKGAFTWRDATGSTVATGQIPSGLGAAERSPLSFRVTGPSTLWALRTFSLAVYPHPGDIPPTDISVLSTTSGNTTVSETIQLPSIPVQTQDGWSTYSTLDSPAWITGTSNRLVYRHRWLVSAGTGNTHESLEVMELWMKSIGGNAQRLDVYAYYSGPGGAIAWRANGTASPTEQWLGNAVKDYRWSDTDLVPFPATFAPKLCYSRAGKIVTVDLQP